MVLYSGKRLYSTDNSNVLHKKKKRKEKKVLLTINGNVVWGTQTILLWHSYETPFTFKSA